MDEVPQPKGEEGDVCRNCSERWKDQHKPLVRLIALPTRTERYNEKVPVCPYCDGPINEVALDALRREIPDAPDA